MSMREIEKDVWLLFHDDHLLFWMKKIICLDYQLNGKLFKINGVCFICYHGFDALFFISLKVLVESSCNLRMHYIWYCFL